MILSEEVTNIKLYTRRLCLRPMEESDASMVVSWRNKGRIRQVIENPQSKDLTIDDHLRWFRSTRRSRVDFVVIIRDVQLPIGVWSLKQTRDSRMYRAMEQSRYIGEDPALGKGYALEASKCLLYYAFRVLELDKVVTTNKRDNERPQKMNLKLGFTYSEDRTVPNGFVRMLINKPTFERLFEPDWGYMEC